jgi:molybdate transport system permease protein
LLNGLVHLPLILPPVVTGYLLLLDLRPPRAGRAVPGPVVRHRLSPSAGRGGAGLRVMAFPLMVRAIRLAIEAVDRGWKQAAGTLGANPAGSSLPPSPCRLILPGIIAGMILAFAKAMGEFGATITFVSNIPGQTQTLPSAIYTFTSGAGRRGEGALRLVLVSIVIAMAALAAVGMGQRGRWRGRMAGQ